VGETETRSETTTPKTGEWEIPVHEQYAEPKATQTLLDDAAYDVEGFLAGKVADRFALQENYAFILGDGIKRPRGLFTYTTAATTDSSRAWGTFEHIKTGVAGGWAASAPADILFDVTYALKAAYRQGAVWTMPRLLVAEIRKFKDENGQYLWQPGLAAGQPQTILSYPVAEMEDIPAKAADSLSIGFGDLRETYQIVDRTGIRVLRDPLTEKPWVKFYTTKRVGGDVVNFESFKFIKFSA
jgi:HK97 family phage major capsid protein